VENGKKNIYEFGGFAMMFDPILKVGFVHFQKEPYRRIGGTRATEMCNDRLMEKNDAPTIIAKPFAPVKVFPIYEKRFIKGPNVLNGRVPYHKKTSIQGIHWAGLIMGPIFHESFAKQWRSREQGVQSQSTA